MTDIDNRPNQVYWFSPLSSTFILCKRLRFTLVHQRLTPIFHPRAFYLRSCTSTKKSLIGYALNRAEIFPALLRRLLVWTHAKCHGGTKVPCFGITGRWGCTSKIRNDWFNSGWKPIQRSVGLLVRKLASRFTASD